MLENRFKKLALVLQFLVKFWTEQNIFQVWRGIVRLNSFLLTQIFLDTIKNIAYYHVYEENE